MNIMVDKFLSANVAPQRQCLKHYGDSEEDLLSVKMLNVPFERVTKQQ